jgi:hypothetical protein
MASDAGELCSAAKTEIIADKFIKRPPNLIILY